MKYYSSYPKSYGSNWTRLKPNEMRPAALQIFFEGSTKTKSLIRQIKKKKLPFTNLLNNFSIFLGVVQMNYTPSGCDPTELDTDIVNDWQIFRIEYVFNWYYTTMQEPFGGEQGVVDVQSLHMKYLLLRHIWKIFSNSNN